MTSYYRLDEDLNPVECSGAGEFFAWRNSVEKSKPAWCKEVLYCAFRIAEDHAAPSRGDYRAASYFLGSEGRFVTYITHPSYKIFGYSESHRECMYNQADAFDEMIEHAQAT